MGIRPTQYGETARYPCILWGSNERSFAVAKYQKLLEPLKIGKVELKNRFIMLPMTIEKVDNYHVTDDLVDFYEQRA